MRVKGRSIESLADVACRPSMKTCGRWDIPSIAVFGIGQLSVVWLTEFPGCLGFAAVCHSPPGVGCQMRSVVHHSQGRQPGPSSVRLVFPTMFFAWLVVLGRIL